MEYECRLSTSDEDLIRRTKEACLELLTTLLCKPIPAPVIASRVHRLAYRMLGDPDPYRFLKQANNADAMDVCREVRGELATFRDLSLAAVIGNTLDYGARVHTVTDDFVDFFHTRFRAGLDVDDTDRIEPLASRVVYFADNCGEIIFDGLLVRYLKTRGAQVTLAVRGGPILNDATREDAVMLGLDRHADLLIGTTDGISELGVNMELIPPVLADALDRCSLIIAKGMANYESLSEYQDLPPVAYMMSVKCGPIAEDIGIPLGSMIALLRE
ncbi:hypothetical protein ASZ90_010064 [hydrocarbon metagenome]|uniref:Damage-control phosphatase ARMT1-like metal-binding domain-containing protein n=1 Tax=hydrocarbon metagenome TaxID=938273 RepID=A0A0W8FH88_9ZZZZ